MNGPQLLGWIGTFIVLGGYGYSVRIGEPYWFHVANFVGSCMIAVAAYDRQAWPSLFLTVCFGAIGFVGAYRIMRADMARMDAERLKETR